MYSPTSVHFRSKGTAPQEASRPEGYCWVGTKLIAPEGVLDIPNDNESVSDGTVSDTDLRKYADIWTKFNVNDVLTALAKTGDDYGIITKTWTLAGTKQDSKPESCTLTVKIDVNNITLLGEDNNTTQILKTSNGKLVYCQVDNAADFKKAIAAPAATAGATIVLASDITLDSAVTVTGRKVTIQGAHTITTGVKDAFQVESSGQLTFGTGLTINSTSSVAEARTGGVLVISGATIVSTNSPYATLFATGENLKIVMNSGTVSNSGTNILTVSVADSAVAEIKGGTVSNSSSSTIVAKTGGLSSLI